MNADNRRFVRLAATALSLAFLGVSASAQSPGRAIATLRAPQVRDFDFLPIRDARLYPETDVFSNPALLAVLSRAFLLLDADASFLRDESVQIRADASIGQKGGSASTVSQSISPNASCAYLAPLKGGKSAFGAFGSLGMGLASLVETKSNYDALSEWVETRDESGSGGFALGAMYAAKAGNVDWGLSGSFSFAAEPHAFRAVTDASAGTPIVSAGAAIRDRDSNDGSLALRSGMSFPLSRSTALAIGLSLSGGYLDRSRNYRTLDTNSDGVNDPQAVTVASYWLERDIADAGNPVTSYDHRDRTWKAGARLFTGIRIALSDSLELFCDLDWDALDLDAGESWERFVYTDSPEGYADQSRVARTRDSSLASGSAVLGLVIGKTRDSLLRLGVGYERLGERRSQDGVNAVGDRLFSAYNPNHYPEVEFFAAAPANGAVARAAGLPWTRSLDSLSLLGAWEVRPNAKMSLFADMEVSGVRRMDEYRVYSLDTRTVWTEKEESLGIDWSVETTAGLSFEVGKGKRLAFDCRLAPLSGYARKESETLPYDLDIGSETEDGSRGLEESNPFGLRLRACLSIAL